MTKFTADQRSEQRATILDKSREMLRLAESQEWNELERVEVERRALIIEHFSVPCPAAESQELADTLREILSLDAHTLPLLESGRSEAGEDLQTANQGKRAQAAYIANES